LTAVAGWRRFQLRETKTTKCEDHTDQTHSVRHVADVCCRGGCVSRNFRIPKSLVRNDLEFVENDAELYAKS
jgi:hypothetical protein